MRARLAVLATLLPLAVAGPAEADPAATCQGTDTCDAERERGCER